MVKLALALFLFFCGWELMQPGRLNGLKGSKDVTGETKWYYFFADDGG